MSETPEDTYADEQDGPSDISVSVAAETDEALADLHELRDAADEAHAAIDGLKDALRSLSETTQNPQKDLEESFLGGMFGGDK